MGALKVRVDGAWVTIPGYGNTIGVPAGGVFGDFLIKNSATGGDALWSTTAPKLKLTPGDTVGLDLNNPALQIGEQTGQNLVGYWGGLISRNNGAASTLRLNYYGGNVSLFGGAAGASALLLGEPTGTGKRTMLDIGGWEFGQDQSNNGTKDFYLYAGAFGTAFNINVTGTLMSLLTGVSNAKLQVGSAGAATLQVGDDAYFQDANVTNGLVIKGVSNAGAGKLCFGRTDAFLTNDGTNSVLQSPWQQYFDASGSPNPNFIWRRTSDFATLLSLSNGGLLTAASDIQANGSLLANGQVYCGSGAYFRVRGVGTGLFWDNVGCGFVANSSGVVEMYPGSNLSMAGNMIRLGSNRDDTNHHLRYYNGYPPGSGEANNGPLLQGYTSVWLHNTAYNKPFYLSSSGNVFIATGQSYLTMSTREGKANIETLDPKECLDHVRHWRPVEFDQKEWPFMRREGFIAEEHVLVTPRLVNVVGQEYEGQENPTLPDGTPVTFERPGWANAIDYGGCVVRLTGAVQALLERIEQLERML